MTLCRVDAAHRPDAVGCLQSFDFLLGSRFLPLDVCGIRFANEELSASLEENLLPVAEVGHTDVVLPTNLRDRQPLNEVGSENGDILLVGIIDTFPLIGQWRQRFCNRQTPAHIATRVTKISKTKQGPRGGAVRVGGCFCVGDI